MKKKGEELGEITCVQRHMSNFEIPHLLDEASYKELRIKKKKHTEEGKKRFGPFDIQGERRGKLSIHRGVSLKGNRKWRCQNKVEMYQGGGGGQNFS